VPEKRDGYTQVSLQVPDELLAAIRAALAGESLNTFFCAAAAQRAGARFKPPKVGRPKKPAKKPKK
jgi:DNA-binding NarL/FixJ family response regulator